MITCPPTAASSAFPASMDKVQSTVAITVPSTTATATATAAAAADAVNVTTLPTPSPLPKTVVTSRDKDYDDNPSLLASASSPDPVFPQPTLRLEIRDLTHPGAHVFLAFVHAADVIATAVANVQRLLYGRSSASPDPATHVPPTRSVTIILRAMDGVAYTTGSELDADHKEIHLSTRYLANIQPRKTRATAEITGVLTHELVHCYQWDGRGSCPGGLVEGIADWVRLRCELAPPHWTRDPHGSHWDAGYQHTAYFLDYLERRFGPGTVRRINEQLRLACYDAKTFWTGLLGHPVEALWDDYIDTVTQKGPKVETTVDVVAE